MKTRTNINMGVLFGAILLTCCGVLQADEYYAGGVTVDIDRDVLGYLWVNDATVNLYENAHIVNDAFFGDIYADSGSVINIYGGQIDGYLFVTTSQNGMPETQVTVYGSDFAVDGVAVAPGTTELFLQSQGLSGVYASGTPFAFMVDCAVTADFYLTVKLGWVESEADIDVSTTAYDSGLVDIGSTQDGYITVSNTGNVNLTLQSLAIVQDEYAEFAVGPLQQLPVTIEPDTSIAIEILFTPQYEGIAQAVLQIVSDDPDEALVEVTLSGEGQMVIFTPAEQIAQIIAFYQASLDDGSIAGLGRGRSGVEKARVFGKTLSAVSQLIDNGYEGYALNVLTMLEQKCDGDRRPCDFVAGEGVAVLNAMINELIDTLAADADPGHGPGRGHGHGHVHRHRLKR